MILVIAAFFLAGFFMLLVVVTLSDKYLFQEGISLWILSKRFHHFKRAFLCGYNARDFIR
jgi:hypothetical protein